MSLALLLHIILILIVLGVIWWIIETYIPIAQPIKTIIYVVIAVFCILWLLSFIGGDVWRIQ